MPFEPADVTRGRASSTASGGSGDLPKLRVSITVMLAGGGVSESFKCGEGAVYCSRCGEGGLAGRRGFHPGDFFDNVEACVSYSIRVIVSNESGIGAIPSGAERGVYMGCLRGACASGVCWNAGSEVGAGVRQSTVSKDSGSAGSSTDSEVSVTLQCRRDVS